MTVALSDYIPSFMYEINPPGQTVITMSDDEAIQRLIDAWWEMRMSGLDFLANWSIDDNGNITPITGAPPNAQSYLPTSWYTDDGSSDIGREIIQAVILFAGYRCVLTQYVNVKTMVASRAGSVSYETQQSSALLQQVLKALTAKIDIVLTRLSDLGATTVTVLDSVIDQTINVLQDDAWFVRGSYGTTGGRDYGSAW